MPTFEYEVIDRAGVTARGRQQAEGQEQLIQTLRERGQLVVALKPTTAQPSTSLGHGIVRFFRNLGGGVKLSVLVLFTVHATKYLPVLSNATWRDNPGNAFGLSFWIEPLIGVSLPAASNLKPAMLVLFAFRT